MAVIKKPQIPESPHYRKLVAALAGELERDQPDSLQPAPRIYEEEQRGKFLNVTVVWDDWKEVEREERGRIIMDAYEQQRPNDVMRIMVALGLTQNDAIQLGFHVEIEVSVTKEEAVDSYVRGADRVLEFLCDWLLSKSIGVSFPLGPGPIELDKLPREIERHIDELFTSLKLTPKKIRDGDTVNPSCIHWLVFADEYRQAEIAWRVQNPILHPAS